MILEVVKVLNGDFFDDLRISKHDYGLGELVCANIPENRWFHYDDFGEKNPHEQGITFHAT